LPNQPWKQPTVAGLQGVGRTPIGGDEGVAPAKFAKQIRGMVDEA
jgi:hypothetical protein